MPLWLTQPGMGPSQRCTATLRHTCTCPGASRDHAQRRLLCREGSPRGPACWSSHTRGSRSRGGCGCTVNGPRGAATATPAATGGRSRRPSRGQGPARNPSSSASEAPAARLAWSACRLLLAACTTLRQRAQGKKAAKAAQPAAAAAGKAPEEEPDFSALDVRVGRVRSVRKHPNADALYVSEIAIESGEPAPRQAKAPSLPGLLSWECPAHDKQGLEHGTALGGSPRKLLCSAASVCSGQP